MKKIVMLFIVVAVFFPSYTIKANEETHRKTAEELINVMEIKDMETQGFEELKRRFMNDMEVMFADMNDKAKVQLIKGQIEEILNKEISWAVLKNEYIKLYTGAFTEEEMKVIIAFYKTPEGKKLMNKIPELMDQSMQIGEQKVLNIMPQVVGKFKGTDSGKQEQMKKERPNDQMHMKKN